MERFISLADSLGLFSSRPFTTPTPQVVVIEKYITPPPTQPPCKKSFIIIYSYEEVLATLPTQSPNGLLDELVLLEVIKKIQSREVRASKLYVISQSEVRRSPAITTISPEIQQMREKIQQLEAKLLEQQEILARHETEEKDAKYEVRLLPI